MLSASLVCMQIVKQKQRFQRAVVSREEALAMFQENKFKVEIITGLPEDATISLYRCARRPQSFLAHRVSPWLALSMVSVETFSCMGAT